MASATYEQINPTSVLRDAMLDPLPEVGPLAYPRILGVPSMLDGSGIASGRSIDFTGGGPLNGTILVRSMKDALAAAKDSAPQTIGDPRVENDWFVPDQRAYAMKQFAGYSKEGIEKISHGFVASESGERLMVQRAASQCHILFEKYVAGFFTNKGVEDIGGKAAAWGEGAELDWQNATVGGEALATSNNAMDVLHSIVEGARLRSGSRVTSCYMGRGLAEKLCREPSVLGRVIVKSGSGDENALAGFQGQRVMPVSYLENVFRDHLEIDELVIGSGIQDANGDGNHTYIWPDRMWLGTAGNIDLAVGGGGARVLSGAGAFCGLIGKIETAVGPEQKNAPQAFEAICEMFADLVALNPAAGTVVYNF